MSSDIVSQTTDNATPAVVAESITDNQPVYYHQRRLKCCPMCGEADVAKGSICHRALLTDAYHSPTALAATS